MRNGEYGIGESIDGKRICDIPDAVERELANWPLPRNVCWLFELYPALPGTGRECQAFCFGPRSVLKPIAHSR